MAWTTSGSWRGMNGQNTLRPAMSSSMGSAVSMANTATATPMAHTGPRPLSELSDDTSRHSRLRITVVPEARMVGPARRRAAAMASWRSSWRTSSSR